MEIDLETLGPESVEGLESEARVKVVEFDVCQDGIANGIAWFWHAELDAEDAITTTPRRFLDQVNLPRGWQQCSSHTWKQALQGIGPTVVQRGQTVPVTMTHSAVGISWEVTGYDPKDAMVISPTFSVWEKDRRLT